MELSFRAALEPCRQGNLQTSISRTFLVGCAIHETVIDSNIPGILWSTCSECIEERATGLDGLSPSIKNALWWIYIYIYIYSHEWIHPWRGPFCHPTSWEHMHSHMCRRNEEMLFTYVYNLYKDSFSLHVYQLISLVREQWEWKSEKTKGFHSMHEMGST